MVAEASKEEPTSPEPGMNKVASLNGPVGVDMGDVNPKVRHALVTKNFELAGMSGVASFLRQVLVESSCRCRLDG